LEFVLTELDLAITFCEVGLTTRSLIRAERNADNARVTLETILRTKKRLTLNQEARLLLSAKTSKLVCLLVQLEKRCLL
jgi:hypothetical protein